jgi:uncharacterized protein YjbJ (UPF0337 family)
MVEGLAALHPNGTPRSAALSGWRFLQNLRNAPHRMPNDAIFAIRFVLAAPGGRTDRAGCLKRKDPTMGDGTGDRFQGAFDKTVGRGESAVGDLTGDDRLRREGDLDQTRGEVEEGVGRAKDALQDVGERAKDAVDDVRDAVGDAFRNLTDR